MFGREVEGRRWQGPWLMAVGLAAAGCSRSAETGAPSAPAARADAPRPVTEWAAQSESRGPAPLLTVPPAPVNPPPAPAASTAAPDPTARAADALQRLITPGIASAEWEAAHQELIDLGTGAAETLRQALVSDNPLAREWSASILALNVDAATAARAELAACLTDESGFVQANAAAALALVPGEAARVLPILVQLAQSPDAELRRMAAVNLSNLGDDAAAHVHLLTPLLSATDPEVVRPVVDLCGRLGAAARPALPRLQQIAFEPQDGALQSAAQLAVQQIEAEASGGETPRMP